MKRQGAAEVVMAKVLVVDDEYAIVETIIDVLESQGYECLAASNGREALDCARQERPDLVVMDVMMPVMDGTEALSEMTEDPELASIPVILMSAAPDAVAVDAFAGRELTFLKKPFDLRVFLQAVAAWVGDPP